MHIFGAYLYVEKFRILNENFNSYDGNKCQTIVDEHKILYLFCFHKNRVQKMFLQLMADVQAWSQSGRKVIDNFARTT